MEENAVKRVMPHSVEAEQSVIGAMILDNQSISDIEGIITPDDFYQKQYGIIFGAITELNKEGKPVDLLTLQTRLREKEVPEEIASMTYIGDVIANVPISVNAKYYAEIVKEKSTLRQLVRAGESIANDCYAGKDSVETIMDDTEKKVFDILNSRRKTEFVSIDQITNAVLEKTAEASKNKSNVTGIPTGFVDLDYKLSGLQNSEMILIAARPSMGKTAFALNIAEYVALRKNMPVAIFSLEMSKEQLVSRLLAMESRVDSQKIKTGSLDDEEWKKFIESAGVIGRSNMIIDDTSGISLGEFRSKCREFKLKYDIKMILIDYLQLMTTGARAESRQQEVAEISRTLKAVAKELAVPVVALSQLSRSPETRNDKRPMMSDLRESGSIEQDADVVMFIYRDDYYHKDTEQTNIAEIIIGKNRNGPVGTVDLAWLAQYTKFTNIKKN